MRKLAASQLISHALVLILLSAVSVGADDARRRHRPSGRCLLQSRRFSTRLLARHSDWCRADRVSHNFNDELEMDDNHVFWFLTFTAPAVDDTAGVERARG